MLSKTVRIFNFDDSITRQAGLLKRFKHTIIGLKKIGPDARLWMNNKTAGRIIECLSPELSNAVTLLGSGDFHHVSSLLIGQFKTPLSVIVFDFHPDWDCLPPKLGCGSWLNSILKMPNVEKVILLGVSSDDISTLHIQTGNLRSLKDNRIEIYPYLHKPTYTAFKKVPDNISINAHRMGPLTKIRWNELKNHKVSEFFWELLGRLKAKNVYVSIDKDCLKPEYSLTNWEEGPFELAALLALLGLIRKNLDIVGLDITGDFSESKLNGVFKRFCSGVDHPKDYSARGKDQALIDSVNERTNIRIIESLIN